ncbi:hypothetical protein RJG79_07965 [Mycoplasmatota bacterium WC44]
MKDKINVFVIVIIISVISHSLLFYHINYSPTESVIKTLKFAVPVGYLFLISLIIYSIELGTPKRIAVLFLIPTVYSFVSFFIVDLMEEIFPFKIAFFLYFLGYYLLVFIAWILNYRFSKSRVILVIGIFEIIKFLIVAIKFMGITLPWNGKTYLIDATRDVFLIWILMIKIKEHTKSANNPKSQLL